MTDEQLEQAEQRARRFSGAWTGTSGTLAADVIHLIRFVRQLQEQPVKDPNHPGYGADVMTPGDQLLDTAARTIRQRRKTYGPAREHFARTVGAINAIFRHKLREPLTEEDWAQIMILDKLARHQEKPHHDNRIDTAGYAACWAECET